MNAFVYTVMALYAIGVAFRLANLGSGNYPRPETVTAATDALAIVIRLGMILWGLHALGWGPQ